jgi:hypothetical protein
MSNRELLELVGETCSDETECNNCDMQVLCRKELHESHPELFKQED